jgi:hypothetical protein
MLDAERAAERKLARLQSFRYFRLGTGRLRPVSFDPPQDTDAETVQLHLEHPLVTRLIDRFSNQGLVHHELSRACLAVTPDAIPRVVFCRGIAGHNNVVSWSQKSWNFASAIRFLPGRGGRIMLVRGIGIACGDCDGRSDT